MKTTSTPTVALAAAFFVVAATVPVAHATVPPVPTVSVSQFYNEHDRAKMDQELKEAMIYVVAVQQEKLQSPVDAHNNPKTAEQMAADKERLAKILNIYQNFKGEEFGDMVDDANSRQPNVGLYKVFMAYIAQELQKMGSIAK